MANKKIIQVVHKPVGKPSRVVEIDIGEKAGWGVRAIHDLVGGIFDRAPATAFGGPKRFEVWFADEGRLRGFEPNVLGLVGDIFVAYRHPGSPSLGTMSRDQQTLITAWLAGLATPETPARTPAGCSTFRVPGTPAHQTTAFDPQLHFTGAKGEQPWLEEKVQRAIDEHGADIVAYADEATPGVTCFPGCYSLQLEFDLGTPRGRAAMSAVRAAYEAFDPEHETPDEDD